MIRRREQTLEQDEEPMKIIFKEKSASKQKRKQKIIALQVGASVVTQQGDIARKLVDFFYKLFKKEQT